jgi:hypothetical protein
MVTSEFQYYQPSNPSVDGIVGTDIFTHRDCGFISCFLLV